MKKTKIKKRQGCEASASSELLSDLRLLSGVAKPTAQEFNNLVEGWKKYLVGIPADKHREEFRLIIQARVQSGCISLIAPFQDGVR